MLIYNIEMGVSAARPKAKLVIHEYVKPLPKFPSEVETGEQIYNYYLQQALNKDIGVYNDIR